MNCFPKRFPIFAGQTENRANSSQYEEQIKTVEGNNALPLLSTYLFNELAMQCFQYVVMLAEWEPISVEADSREKYW